MEAGAATDTSMTGSGTRVLASGFVGVGVGVLRLTEKRQMLLLRAVAPVVVVSERDRHADKGFSDLLYYQLD